jgi:hypothetical protein
MNKNILQNLYYTARDLKQLDSGRKKITLRGAVL